FDHNAFIGEQSELFGGLKENIGRRFLGENVFATHDSVPGLERKTNLAKVSENFDSIGARGDGSAQSFITARADQRFSSGKDLEPCRHQFEIDFVSTPFGSRQVERELIELRHSADITIFSGAYER